MTILLVLTFIIGYICIAFEHPLQLDKAAAALLTGVLCWVIFVFGYGSTSPTATEFIHTELLHHVAEISQILFFLLGAMTIVEMIDVHGGFNIITSFITTTHRIKLIWVIGLVTFFLSAVLDNLTTTIVMAALLKKLMTAKKDLWFFAGIVVIAANAGGAWSPIGDVTTIMLWIGGQISAVPIMQSLFVPSLVCLIVPLLAISFGSHKNLQRPEDFENAHTVIASKKEATFVLWLGVAGLLFVPIFKHFTHLPPFMGILFSLGVLWVATSLIHYKKPEDAKHLLSVASVIRKVDTPSVLFFLGILLAVACLQSAGLLQVLAQQLDTHFGNSYAITTLIGLFSAIVDNVPLVAGAMGMYPLTLYPQDDTFWQLLAYCAGTGGSALIIGSAAGVAMMGILKVDFIWYAKNISWLALLGYVSGIVTFALLH